MAAAAGISAWLLVQHDGPAAAPAFPSAPSTTETAPADGLPQGPLTVGELRASAERLDQPLYWVGARSDRRYQLERDTASGATAVHYLTPPGDAELTVSTIPLADAFATTEKLAGRPTSVSQRLAGDGIAWSSRERPLTAYVAYPGVDYVIEVDAPMPGLARQVAFGGRVAPVG